MMEGQNNRRWIFTRRPDDGDVRACLRLETAALPELQEGEVLIRNRFLAMDPAIRTWMDDVPNYRTPLIPGQVMEGTAVGDVVASRNARFKPGDVVLGVHGWEEYSVGRAGFFASQVLPRIDGIACHHFLGVLGPTGVTAYFAALDKMQPQPGETVLISAAAGAVGSVAGQICRLKGARVIGLAGTDEKCGWLTEVCGFDAAINYHTRKDDLAEAVLEAAPHGVDIYFDNVGGEIFDAALDAMKDHGRITLCGFISGYGNRDGHPAPPVRNLWQFLIKRLTMNAFLLTEYTGRFGEAIQEMVPWVRGGEIRHREHIVAGLENAADAFLMLFDGRNEGKLIVEI